MLLVLLPLSSLAQQTQIVTLKTTTGPMIPEAITVVRDISGGKTVYFGSRIVSYTQPPSQPVAVDNGISRFDLLGQQFVDKTIQLDIQTTGPLTVDVVVYCPLTGERQRHTRLLSTGENGISVDAPARLPCLVTIVTAQISRTIGVLP